MKQIDQSTTEKEIKKALIDTGVRPIDIARTLKISRQYIHKVIKGQRHTDYVRRAIAKHARKRVRDLWPSSPSRKAA